MTRQRIQLGLCSLSACLLGFGCMPKMDIETMKQMRPKRPEALEKLNAFVGNWQSVGEMKMAGMDEPLKTTGSSQVAWEGDGWYLVERSHYTMGELGDMQSMAMWTYDSKRKRYRTTWADDFGSFGTRVVRHDEKSGVWHMTANMHTPFGDTLGKGTITFPSSNKMEWTWKEYTMCGLIQTSEMKGTSTKR